MSEERVPTASKESPPQERTRSLTDTKRSIALQATNLSRSFGDVSVLEAVSLSVGRGELVVVIGPNGSGKSTLMEALAGIRAPDRGTVTITSPTEATTERRAVGYLPQRPSFRRGFSTRDTLEFYARFVDDTAVDAAVTETLDRVGLSDVAGRTVGSLSGGMTRLLGLGQAILGHPSVLVLDEPGSGLDPAMVERLFGILRSLADDDTGIVVTSHNLEAVEKYADTVVLLDRGEVVLSGTLSDVLASTESETLVEAFLTTVQGEDRESTVRAGQSTEVNNS
jgi:ABC-type multidrug transport system ATPase subunit